MRQLSITTAAILLLAAVSLARGELPSGESILDRFVDVTGGKDAHGKFKNRTTRGRIEIPGSDASGTFEIVQAESPDRAVLSVGIKDAANSRMGMSGDVVWSISDVMGVEIKRGAERDSLVRQLTLDVDSRWREFFKSAETIGEETIDGRRAYQVKLTAPDGSENIRFYDAESGELVQIIADIRSPAVQLRDVVRISDYKDFDGVRLPTRVLHDNPTMKLAFVTESVEHDRDIPDSTFDLPKSVKDLLAKQAARSGTTTAPSK
jgi:hypothetical protein